MSTRTSKEEKVDGVEPMPGFHMSTMITGTESNGPLYAKLSQILGAMTSVPKKGYNDFHKYHYVTEGDLAEVIRPLLAKHGIGITFGITGEPVVRGDITQVICEIRIGDSEGHEIVTHVPGWGQDKGDKGGYKAMTGAVKYWLYKTFLVSTGDDPEREEKPVQQAHTQQAPQAPAPAVKSEGPGPMCPKCGSSMHLESRVSKAGKPYGSWVCDHPTCDKWLYDSEWKKQQQHQ